MTDKRHSGKTAAQIAAMILALLLMMSFVAAGIMFGGEIATLMSIERIGDEDLFTMEYKGDYGLDKFLETGASSDGELVQFIVRQVLHGIPLEFELPDLGCSTFAAALKDGTPVFGRNFDMYDSPAMLLTTRPKDGYASISMVNLAYIGYSAEHLPVDMKSSVMALLAAVKQVPQEGKRSTTQWSCVYDLENASVDVVMDMNYGQTYAFSL